jgi:hypothetical protein
MSFNVLVVIVMFNVIATITLWLTAARRPEKLKKKFFAALVANKPIVPRVEVVCSWLVPQRKGGAPKIADQSERRIVEQIL